LVDRLAANQLQDQERLTAYGNPAIEKPCDVGMIEVREELPLGPKTLEHALATEAPAHKLDCHFLLVLRISAARSIHGTHTAASDAVDELVGTDALTQPAICVLRGLEGRRELLRRVIQN
jgi:hypothetical protein